MQSVVTDLEIMTNWIKYHT